MPFKMSLTLPKVAADTWWSRSKNEMNRLVEEYNRQNWPSQKDPVTGKAWAPRVQPTGTWPLLNRTGTMFGTAKFFTTKEIGIFKAKTTNYGPYQQYGTSKMVARRWLGINQALCDPLARVIGKNIFRGSRTVRIGS